MGQITSNFMWLIRIKKIYEITANIKIILKYYICITDNVSKTDSNK